MKLKAMYSIAYFEYGHRIVLITVHIASYLTEK